jgi:hypothetical protein
LKASGAITASAALTWSYRFRTPNLESIQQPYEDRLIFDSGGLGHRFGDADAPRLIERHLN